MQPSSPAALAAEVTELRLGLTSGPPIVERAEVTVKRGEILGLVGESGSGKSTLALSLLGFTRRGVRIDAGDIRISGEQMVGRGERELRRLRGRLVSYVPQDPATALNPAMRIGTQLEEILEVHFEDRDPEVEVPRALERVQLPATPEFRRRFPHQLSGGQQQRVAIAMAIIGAPPLVVLDEPTTGLDVITQAHILAEIARLRVELGVAMVYVSHDLAVVGKIADRVAVMYAGTIVEDGPTMDVLATPRHPYTRALVRAIPDHQTPRRLIGLPGVAVGVMDRPPGCPFSPRCPQRSQRCAEMPAPEAVGPGHSSRCFHWRQTPQVEPEAPLTAATDLREAETLLAVESLHAGYPNGVVAARDITFELRRGESVALVGESGSGKTTIARCIAGLHPVSGGRIVFDGQQLGLARDRSGDARRRIQIVFQNPYDSLNPRHLVGQAVARPAKLLRGLTQAQAGSEAERMLELVRLPKRLAERHPRELSGGERQRVAIARALVAQPELLVCDEITSALDVSVQAAIVELLAELRIELGLSLLFISHDLGVVAAVCDRVLVLQRGDICEQGEAATLLRAPSAPYTQSLLASAVRLPQPDRARDRSMPAVDGPGG
jgi:peptide/nickel transport system ATP-binding protein